MERWNAEWVIVRKDGKCWWMLQPKRAMGASVGSKAVLLAEILSKSE